MGFILEFVGLTKAYGQTFAIKDATLSVLQGEILVILGPSGSGKSTLLQIAAGLINSSAGQILLRGRDITNIPIHRRNLGLVMQGYSLFPHMTAYQNVAYSLQTKTHRCSSGELRKRVSRMFDLMRLTGLEGRKPREMSGGQQQRVALARALVFNPDVLLLDEPLGALDRELRERMELEIRKIQRMLGTTVLYVTHDQGEAMSVADRITVLRNGTFAQVGTPTELYQHPNSQFVAEFLGGANLLSAKIVRESEGRAVIQTAVGEFLMPVPQYGVVDKPLAMMVRPERLNLDPPIERFNTLSGTLLDVTFLGNMCRATISLADDTLWYVNLAPEFANEGLESGRSIDLFWKISDTQLLAADEGLSTRRKNDNVD